VWMTWHAMFTRPWGAEPLPPLEEVSAGLPNADRPSDHLALTVTLSL